MNRSFYLDLARCGLRMPIGTDLVLPECDMLSVAGAEETVRRKVDAFVALRRQETGGLLTAERGAGSNAAICP